MKNKNHKFIQGVVLSACLIGTAHAATYNEVSDTGDLMGTAQSPDGTGDLTAIFGSLGSNGGADDVDLYRILVTDTSLFSVNVTASLSADNDAMLFLFNSAGNLMLTDDDSGAGSLPGLSVGSLSAHAPGVYYLAFDLFYTTPTYTGGTLTGWSHAPNPMQTGNYTLNLTGVGFAPSAVPIPAAAWLLGTGLAGLVGVSRRPKSVS